MGHSVVSKSLGLDITVNFDLKKSLSLNNFESGSLAFYNLDNFNLSMGLSLEIYSLSLGLNNEAIAKKKWVSVSVSSLNLSINNPGITRAVLIKD